jgi:hypothetical protein
MKRLVFLLVAFGLMVGAVWAVRTLPWWALVALFVALIVFAKFAIKKLLKQLFLTPFKMKGAVLHEATAEIHSVRPSDAPTKVDRDAEQEEPAVARRYFTLEVTILPKDAAGKFSHWEPGELRLTRPEHHVSTGDEPSTEDDSCEVSELQYEEDGVFKADEGFKFEGPKRLKMTLGVREGVGRLKFGYYFEEFGEVALPPPFAAAA